MEWTADVAAGDWLRARIDDPWRGTMHDVVPRGFAAYARVFHPVFRERPVGREWPAGGEDAAARAAWQAFNDDAPEIDTERVTWADTASAFGTTMHPRAQWGRLIGRDEPYGNGGAPRDAAGWRYDEPNQGQLAPDDLAALARVLAAHTTTPDAGGIAVWEGWGDLVGAKNFPPPEGCSAACRAGTPSTRRPTSATRPSMPGINRWCIAHSKTCSTIPSASRSGDPASSPTRSRAARG
ncbi:hypothetical protein ET475_06460 [Microbacterium protaetiae]|uniref:Uncharacterized protein n=1 Tax=Microbacterium protaetiae TaxID=2509458 RepID=A0A4P6EEX8_9MICO|nr:hypothetical protein [Microbacterium protaetiae]QAY59669.1 hypothetical protein ET475_06460 [Microbacterium protaetiae]